MFSCFGLWLGGGAGPAKAGLEVLHPIDACAQTGMRIKTMKPLTDNDVWELNRMYSCPGTPSTPPPLVVDRSRCACKDFFPLYFGKNYCPGWQKAGFCAKTSPHYQSMRRDCQKTCGLCSETPVDTCRDTRGSCGAWEGKGWCTDTSDTARLRFVRAHCRVTCSAPCVPATAPAAVSEAVPVQQASAGRFYLHADAWKAMTKHASGQFYVRQVREGATVWKGLVTVQGSTKPACRDMSTTTVRCVDAVTANDVWGYYKCATWQRLGYCKPDSPYFSNLKRDCQRTCGFCTAGTQCAVSKEQGRCGSQCARTCGTCAPDTLSSGVLTQSATVAATATSTSWRVGDHIECEESGCTMCPFLKPCPAGQYQSGSCSGRSNRATCKACSNTNCAAGSYRVGTCSGTTNGFSCKACSGCGAGKYRSGGCSGTSDATCATCSGCGAGKYRSSGCAGTSNSVCATCSNINCGTGKYRSGTCSGTSNGYSC